LARLSLLAGVGLVVSVIAGDAQTGYGQIVLQNNTSVTLDLFVDGRNSCRALRNLTCTTQERAGFHTLAAQAPDQRSAQATVDLQSGQVVTWTISEQ
jgi:hypothetical protein